ncbi:Protein asteroid 1 [Cichlidogyrus casuarinus]|uniref:Protein asteroid 1 n=1 Tax=Cichlidogyrus casuarinus TaxID=1844966 RepID=A0ABD2QMK8_9PLAT
MGIRGLTTVLQDKYPGCFVDFSLRNSFVVIDYGSFMHYLNRISHLTPVYGGEAQKFALFVATWLDRFKECNIKPIFIKDGIPHLYKENEAKERMEKKIAKAQKIMDSNFEKISCFLPQAAKVVMKETVLEHDYPLYLCDDEADGVIAGISVLFKAPVLTNDSDFFIFATMYPEIQVISWDSLDKYATHDSQGSYLTCLKYEPKYSFLNALSHDQLILFSAICGNDFTIGHSLYKRIFTNATQYFSAKYFPILAKWILGYKEPELCIESLLKKFTVAEREQISSDIRASAELYKLQYPHSDFLASLGVVIGDLAIDQPKLMKIRALFSHFNPLPICLVINRRSPFLAAQYLRQLRYSCLFKQYRKEFPLEEMIGVFLKNGQYFVKERYQTSGNRIKEVDILLIEDIEEQSLLQRLGLEDVSYPAGLSEHLVFLCQYFYLLVTLNKYKCKDPVFLALLACFVSNLSSSDILDTFPTEVISPHYLYAFQQAFSTLHSFRELLKLTNTKIPRFKDLLKDGECFHTVMCTLEKVPPEERIALIEEKLLDLQTLFIFTLILNFVSKYQHISLLQNSIIDRCHESKPAKAEKSVIILGSGSKKYKRKKKKCNQRDEIDLLLKANGLIALS